MKQWVMAWSRVELRGLSLCLTPCLTSLAIGVAALAAFPMRGDAAELALTQAAPSVEVHGFVSQGFIKTSANNYLTHSAARTGSFEFTEVGINFTSQIADRLRIGVQLFARDLGPLGTYSAKMDWFYLDYRWRDWLGIRAGRVKLPYGLYNDIGDIDAARVPILLPQSVYPLNNRDFLLAQTGMEVYGYANLGAGGALDYRLYAGTIYIDLPNPTGAPIQYTALHNPYIVGGRLLWETPLEGLRVGGSVQVLKLDASFVTPATAPRGWLSIPAVLWVTSAEYARHDLLLSAEYGRWHVSSQSSDPVLAAPTRISEQMYLMGSYRLSPRLQPGAYYSLHFQNVDGRSWSGPGVQHDVAATLRFDINSHWLVKVEGHYMHGTAGLTQPLNVGRTLREDWVVGLVKTTAYF